MFNQFYNLVLGAQSVACLGLLIFVHELGHFLLAKLCGVGVIEFAIGFGKKVFSKTIGETTYALRLIPLGGFVRMVGEDPRFSDSETSITGPSAEVSSDPNTWFVNKGYFARAAIVVAGPLFNLIFAVFLGIFSVYIYGKGEPQPLPVIGEVIPGFPAAVSGLKSGDLVKLVNNEPVESWEKMALAIGKATAGKLLLQVEREGKVVEVPVQATRERSDFEILDMGVQSEEERAKARYKIGIVPDVIKVPASLGESVAIGFHRVVYYTEKNVQGIWAMLTGIVSAKNLGGPILIVEQAAKSANKGFEHLLEFTILLSVGLAVLNLLPIPILDGGHILFFTIEAVLGIRLHRKVVDRAQQVGMFLLFALMAFAMINDLQRLVGGSIW